MSVEAHAVTETPDPDGAVAEAVEESVAEAPGVASFMAGIEVPSAEDLMAFLDLRDRFEAFFERVGRAWLDEQIANDSGKWITNKAGWLTGFDRNAISYAYYPDAWSSRNYSETIQEIPLAEVVPEYGAMVQMLQALGDKSV